MSEKLDDDATKILMLMSHRGFIWGPSPEIYNPVKGSYEFGPLGKLMKTNLENYIRKKFRKFQFWEVQCPLIGSDMIWKASGHAERFFDYIVQCCNPKCQHVHRADTLLESLGYNLLNFSLEGFQKIIDENNIVCPDCEGKLGKVTTQNLMVTSQLGFPAKEFILRPETATTTYLLFPRLYQYFRTKLPILVFQMGYAFRNEISPRKMLLRTREFEQCEGQIFITPEQEMDFKLHSLYKEEKIPLLSASQQIAGNDKVEFFSLQEAIDKKVLQKPAYAWLLYLAYDMVKGLEIPEENIRLRQHKNDEKAHYAHDAWDLEINSKIYGWTEVCGIHDRGDYDLGRHFKFSKKKQLQVPGPNKGEKIIPHILEIAFGLGRLFFFCLEQAFSFEEERNVLDLPIQITPIPFAVFPLMKKPEELSKVALEIYQQLIDNDISAIYDETGSIGKRYRRTEEVGVRYAFTIDHQTLDDNTLTIRSIEDMSQKRISQAELVSIASRLLRGTITYDEIEDLAVES
ncbi:MAG: glycine--tRNA ligase [Promethearchaeia archaeon]|nr:MAG: glycine--tRNA ligase [Candidatus Lokiarchaeia archaeon]